MTRKIQRGMPPKASPCYDAKGNLKGRNVAHLWVGGTPRIDAGERHQKIYTKIFEYWLQMADPRTRSFPWKGGARQTIHGGLGLKERGLFDLHPCAGDFTR